MRQFALFEYYPGTAGLSTAFWLLICAEGLCYYIKKYEDSQWGVIVLKIQESAENYLEAILVIHNRQGNVRSIDIANELSFSKPSVSVAMKNLRTNGYIEVDKEGFITLLDKGREIAEKIYERHTFITDWLTAMGVSPEVAAEDACRIEHVISSETFEALKAHVSRQNDEKK